MSLELRSFRALAQQFESEGMNRDLADCKAYELLYKGKN